MVEGDPAGALHVDPDEPRSGVVRVLPALEPARPLLAGGNGSLVRRVDPPLERSGVYVVRPLDGGEYVPRLELEPPLERSGVVRVVLERVGGE